MKMKKFSLIISLLSVTLSILAICLHIPILTQLINFFKIGFMFLGLGLTASYFLQ
ncbi:MAG: hypothetical protein N4A50_08390 [Vallitalea sp.]|jgi:hypothetical protein|nr:hypothetical protein [Vallitalea sp.]